ncbi:MAG: FtsX-like permease family protein, partial [Gemmatimonadota bacterium]
VGGVGDVLWVVLGGVAIILLVASANVANLLLVRAESGGHAVAIQAALGAGRSRLVARFLTESGTLGVLGGVLGVGLAMGGIQVLKAEGPAELPRLEEVGLDPTVLLFAAVVSVLVGLVVGLLPLARAWSSDVASVLKENRRGFSTGRSRNRARNTLVVAQLALALVLLVGSGLMIRSFVGLMRAKPGYSDPGELLTFRLIIGSSEVPDWQDVAGAFERLSGRIAEIPGVVSVGLSSSVPMDGRGGFDPVYVEDAPLPEGQQAPIRRFKWIGGGYHEAIGNPVIAGRAITWDDLRQRSRVVMITEGMAQQYWGDPSAAIGRRIGTGFGPGDWREVIGVVGDVRDDGIEHDPVDIVYWPMAMDTYWSDTRGDAPFVARGQTFVVRSSRVGTPGFLDEIRDVVWAAYPTRPLGSIRTMASMQRESMARTSFALVMLGIAAALALLLGAIGIYGVISYAVGQRRHEMGIRIAMGAEPRAVTVLVLRQGLALAGIGVVVGTGVAAAATRLMEAILFGVNPLDPLTYTLVAAVLAAIALLAAWLPARRAAGVDPATALRAEGM